MPSCAICTAMAPASELTRQPLGTNGALVLVCRACDEEPAREMSGPQRGYDIGDAAERVSAAEIRRRCSVITGESPSFNGHGAWIDDVSPGFVVVRVKRDLIHPMDNNEARETLRGRPWFADLRYLGSTNSHILFERPSDATMAKIREERDRANLSSAMSTLEGFRVVTREGREEREGRPGRAGCGYTYTTDGRATPTTGPRAMSMRRAPVTAPPIRTARSP